MLNFEKTEQQRGSDIGFRIKIKTQPETDPILSDDNPLITPEIKKIITPDLLNATLRIQFFTPQEAVKENSTPLLTLITNGSPSVKLHTIVNNSTSQEAIGVVKGSQNLSWEKGKIFYFIDVMPVGSDSYTEVDNSLDYFILK